MIIFFYKGLTRNLEIGSFVWVLPNIWRPGQVKDRKFGTDVSDEILLNAAECQGYSFYRFWVIKGKPTESEGKITRPPRLELTLIRLDFLRVVSSGGGIKLTPSAPFIFQEELIQYQCNFMQLLSNLFKVRWKWKNADVIWYKLTSLVSL